VSGSVVVKNKSFQVINIITVLIVELMTQLTNQKSIKSLFQTVRRQHARECSKCLGDFIPRFYLKT
jgi:hypothetical protein